MSRNTKAAMEQKNMVEYLSAKWQAEKETRKVKLRITMYDRFGCSLGGGDWNVVQPMIEKELADYPGKIEIWRLNK